MDNNDGLAVKVPRNTHYCCVPQCKNYERDGFYFHRFPSDESLKKKWEVALRMGKSASQYMVVCSAHFKATDYFPGAKKVHRLKRDIVPSENLPKRSHDHVETAQESERKKNRAERAQKRMAVTSSSPKVNKASVLEEEQIPIAGHEEMINLLPEVAPAQVAEDKTVGDNFEKHKDIHTQTDGCPIHMIVTNKGKLYTYTGLHSFELLDGIVVCVSELEKNWTTRQKTLSLRDRVILTFCKLKLNLSWTAMEPLFGVSRFSCRRYFQELIPLLSTVLQSVVPWPSVEDIRANLPISFRNYMDTRVVIDCAETPVERSKCIKFRIMTYSQYKKNHTAKFKVGVAPSGLITSVSKCYGGRASDKLITLQSHVLDKCDFRDGIMVDKGFQIEKECLERNLILHRPPFLHKKKQLSREEALTSADIARARVHVERVIQRIREFELVGSKVSWSLLPYFDLSLIVACGIVNLSNPVINIDKFM